MGVTDQKAWFVAFVVLIKHFGAKINQFFAIFGTLTALATC